MFERWKLVKIWRHAHDCHFIARRLMDEVENAEDRNKLDCELRHEHTLYCQLDMCYLLTVDYVAFLPTTALSRQWRIRRIPIDDLEFELIAEYERLALSLRRWTLLISAAKQWRTYRKIFGDRAEWFAARMDEFANRFAELEQSCRSQLLAEGFSFLVEGGRSAPLTSLPQREAG